MKGLRATLLSSLVLLAGTAHAQADVAGTIADPAQALRTRFAVLTEKLAHNQFQRPLWMESSESSVSVSGKIYAIVDYPFATAGAALEKPTQWCDILILHLNTKYCRPTPDGKALNVKIGKKFDQPVESAYRVDFDYRVVARTASFLQVTLSANEGPLSTRDYRIVLEAAPADDGRTLIRLSYSYSFGTMGRLAMELYLGTVGRDKVGFTVTGQDSAGRPSYVKGMRGVVERNTMRYYLAIEAFLGAQSEPAVARVDKSLRDWFAATETYARQLHEMERGEYLDMKRKEYTRQQVLVVTKS